VPISSFASQTWQLWACGFILFSILCVALGHTARPMRMTIYCVPIAIVLAVSSPLAFQWTSALICTPFAGGWLTSAFRHGHFKPFELLSGSVVSMSGLVSVYFESWFPTIVVLGAVLLAVRIAPHLSRLALLIASSLPTVVAAVCVSLLPWPFK
jgi:hypothetical protein